jgi:hypothetical protein
MKALNRKALNFLPLALALLIPVQALALLPIEEREAENKYETKLKKGEAYTAALAALGRSDDKYRVAIKSRDSEQAKIAGKVEVERCAPVGVLGMKLDSQFNFAFEAKDGKVRLSYDDINATNDPHPKKRPAPVADLLASNTGPHSKEELDRIVENCIRPFEAKIQAAFRKVAKAEENW